MATRDIEPGMDDAQAAMDRKGYTTTMDMVTGKGNIVAMNDMGGPEVGNPYCNDPMGEDYSPVTFVRNEPDWGGAPMAPTAVMPRKTEGGAMIASAPQTRTAANGK